MFILVLHPCCSQDLQVFLDEAEGLLKSLLPLLQSSAGAIQSPVHFDVLLWAEVTTCDHQGPQTFLRWGRWVRDGKRKTRDMREYVRRDIMTTKDKIMINIKGQVHVGRNSRSRGYGKVQIKEK